MSGSLSFSLPERLSLTAQSLPRPPPIGDGTSPCLIRVSLLSILWVRGSGFGWCEDEGRRGWGGAGRMQEGGD